MNTPKHPTIGIIGIGMVGSQLERYFREVKKLKRGSELFLYDADLKKIIRLRDRNTALLSSQNISVQDVSSHNYEQRQFS